MSVYTTADFHCDLNSSLSNDKLMIFVIAGMQVYSTHLSSFVEIISSSHDLVGMSTINFYSWSSVSVVNLLSAGVSYTVGVYGLVVVSFDLIFSILFRKWLANLFANSSSVLFGGIGFRVFPLIIMFMNLYSFLVSCLPLSIRVWRE